MLFYPNCYTYISKEMGKYKMKYTIIGRVDKPLTIMKCQKM